MMSFYDRKGIESWSQGVVPHFITCNAFIGKAYAKVLQGFIRDAVCGGRVALDSSQPLYIIELGTGSGKFSYYMLKALEEMSATLDFPISKVCVQSRRIDHASCPQLCQKQQNEERNN